MATFAVMVARYNLMTNFYNEPGQTYKPGQTYNEPGQTGAGPCQSFWFKIQTQKDRNLVTNTSGRAFHCLGLMGHMNICLS